MAGVLGVPRGIPSWGAVLYSIIPLLVIVDSYGELISQKPFCDFGLSKICSFCCPIGKPRRQYSKEPLY